MTPAKGFQSTMQRLPLESEYEDMTKDRTYLNYKHHGTVMHLSMFSADHRSEIVGQKKSSNTVRHRKKPLHRTTDGPEKNLANE